METGYHLTDPVALWLLLLHHKMGDSIMTKMRDGLWVQCQVHLTCRQLPSMKLGTFLDSSIAQSRRLSCSLTSLQEPPKVFIPTILKELESYTTCKRFRNGLAGVVSYIYIYIYYRIKCSRRHLIKNSMIIINKE
jgi:hypothetical protein